MHPCLTFFFNIKESFLGRVPPYLCLLIGVEVFNESNKVRNSSSMNISYFLKII